MTFDDILASCIEALAQGTTIEACLQQYPAHAAALEPLLQLAAALASEPKTQMSSQAFTRGRAELAARARQQQAQHTPASVTAQQHRGPVTARSQHRALVPGYTQKTGLSQLRRPQATKAAHWSAGLPRLLRVALVLLLLVGTTTLLRYTASSLPGTLFYPLKSTGEQVVGILMKAAGEDITWNADQAERRLNELARLPQAQETTAQALSESIAQHWDAVLAATSLLPTDERTAILQKHLTRLEQLEMQWAAPQVDTQSVAVTTLRQMITTGEQALESPQAVETMATPSVSLTGSPTTPTPSPSTTPLVVLQATATSVPPVAPVLIASATPTQPPATLLPVPATATPTLIATAPPSATPLPVITVVIPNQESDDNDSGDSNPDNNDNQDDDEPADADEPAATETPTLTPTDSPTPVILDTDTATPAISTPEPTPTNADVTVTATPLATLLVTVLPSPISTGSATGVATGVATPASTPSATREEATATRESNPPATATAELPPPTPTKMPQQPTATAAPATATPKPTTQATATKTPKATNTPEEDEGTDTPDESEAPTVVAPIEPLNTPIPPATPRPTNTSAEPTKTPRA